MNKEQKEALQSQLNSEKQTISELKKTYEKALADCETKIKELSMRKDMENLQSIIYQKQYQQAIKGQLEGILEQLHGDSFATVSDYLARCYEDGFLGTMYDLAGQGIPLIIPIDQSQAVQAIQTKSKLSKSLYDRLGEDVNALKKAVRQEVSRGIASGSSWVDVATNLASNFTNTPFSKAYNYAIRIARTEGHRIGIQAASDAQHKAKAKGADVVKQWDATLDGRTRDSHRKLDGQIRELDEDFEVDGMRASAPSMFGDPSEDVNCRCALLQRARWALDEDELETLREKAAYHGTLVDDSKAYGHEKAKDFSDFKSKYLKAADALVRSDAQKMKMSATSNDSVWDAKGNPITKDQYKDLMKYAREKGIDLSGFKQYDGDIETIKKLIDNASSVAESYPEILSGRKKLTVMLDELMDDADFARTDNHIVHLNANAFRNAEKLEQQYQKLVADKWFVQGTNSDAIIFHEIGHVVANRYGLDAMSIAQEITGFGSTAQVLDYVESILSKYSAAYNDGIEIISECFASVYNSTTENDFALRFVEKCGKIIKNQ